MRTLQTDVAVVGAGTAGLSARREAARVGRRVLLIEAGPHGTTCARVGCMPSKLLVAAADVAHQLTRAAQFGIEGGAEMHVNDRAVLGRVRRERDRFVRHVVDAVEAIPAQDRLAGHARFVGATSLVVGDRTRVEAKAVVIATGAAPWIPPALQSVVGPGCLSSDDVFELLDLPRSIAVFGTGAVGLELGQALQRLGVRTSFYSPFRQVGPFTDPDVETAARTVLGRELRLHLAVDYAVARDSGTGFVVRWRPADRRSEREEQESFEALLVAAGRRPRLEALDLAAAGLALDERGLPPVDPYTLQCGDAPIFLAGDANGDRPFLHEASDEGAIAGRNAARHPAVVPEARRTPLSVVFTDPQMALVGSRRAELAGQDVEIGTARYDDQGRARILGRNAGMIRVYAARDGRLLGGEMLGPGVEHTAHLLAWAIHRGCRAEEAYGLPVYHPVLEEALRSALRDLCRRLGIVCASAPADLEHGPGA